MLISNGEQICFWHDVWIENDSLKYFFLGYFKSFGINERSLSCFYFSPFLNRSF